MSYEWQNKIKWNTEKTRVKQRKTKSIKGGLDLGIDTCWFNFIGLENKTDIVPTYEIKHLPELLDLLDIEVLG